MIFCSTQLFPVISFYRKSAFFTAVHCLCYGSKTDHSSYRIKTSNLRRNRGIKNSATPFSTVHHFGQISQSALVAFPCPMNTNNRLTRQAPGHCFNNQGLIRSEEHTSELQSPMYL